MIIAAGGFALPAEPHLPGITPRPSEAIFAGPKALVAADLAAAPLGECGAFRYGRAAFVAGYYWEAHELWEAVWAHLPPAAPERLFLAAMIQFANAGLKRRMGRDRAADRILVRADAALGEAMLRLPKAVLGSCAAEAAALRRQAADDSQACSAK